MVFPWFSNIWWFSYGFPSGFPIYESGIKDHDKIIPMVQIWGVPKLVMGVAQKMDGAGIWKSYSKSMIFWISVYFRTPPYVMDNHGQ